MHKVHPNLSGVGISINSQAGWGGRANFPLGFQLKGAPNKKKMKYAKKPLTVKYTIPKCIINLLFQES
jgi:hypothetical protein